MRKFFKLSCVLLASSGAMNAEEAETPWFIPDIVPVEPLQEGKSIPEGVFQFFEEEKVGYVFKN